MTKITLEIDGITNSIEFNEDLNGTELLRGFCSLMIGQTYLISTVKQSLKEVLDEYKQDATLIVQKNENLCDK